jgi:hypothetical protein
MKKFLTFFVMALSLALFVESCDKGPKSPDVEGYETYSDDKSGLSLEFPKNWAKTTTPVRFVVFNDNQGKTRFTRYDTDGFPAAKIDVNVVAMDTTYTIDSVMKKSMKFTPDSYEITDATVGGLKAKKLVYAFELNTGAFNGEMYVIEVDSTNANIIQIEAFDGTFEKYEEAFKKVLSSYKPGKMPVKRVDTITQIVEAPLPSQTMTTKNGMGYSIQIPDNFAAERSPSNGVLESKNFIGERRADCNIIVDVIDASKNKKLDKIVEDNRATYKNATPNKTKIDGKDAYLMNYSFGKDALSRVFFVINGDKLYRITVNWFKGEQSDYLPIFEKSINSFKFN